MYTKCIMTKLMKNYQLFRFWWFKSSVSIRWLSHIAFAYYNIDFTINKYAISRSSFVHSLQFLDSKLSTLFALPETFSLYGLQVKLSPIIIPRYLVIINLLEHLVA